MAAAAATASIQGSERTAAISQSPIQQRNDLVVVAAFDALDREGSALPLGRVWRLAPSDEAGVQNARGNTAKHGNR